MIDSCDPNIVVATETWLTPHHADGEIGEPAIFAHITKSIAATE